MSTESDKVKQENDELQADAAVALGTKEFGAAVTSWILSKDPVTPPPPPPPPPPNSWQNFAGIATGAKILSRTVADKQKELGLVKEVGAKLVRFDYGGTPHDDEVEMALSMGLQPIVVLYGTTGVRGDTALVSQTVAKFKGRVRYYELCNEVDLHGWTPDGYADFYKASATIIRGGDAAAKIISSGLWKGDNRSPIIPPEEFCKALIARVPVSLMDYFGIHNYDPIGWVSANNQWKHLDACRMLLNASGRGLVGIACTEGGGGRGIGDAEQTARVTELLDALKSGRINIACVFSMLPDFDAGYQLVQDSGTKRPAFAKYKQLVS